ncbi:MAG: hypothetical protein QOG60_1695 [Frankiaceae bacterium]|nr:hypothetical protein [Frankiaceae bacterium]
MDRDRLSLLFPDGLPPGLDLDDPEAVLEAFEETSGRGTTVPDMVLAQMVLEGQPPQLWGAVERMRSGAVAADEIWLNLRAALAPLLFAVDAQGAELRDIELPDIDLPDDLELPDIGASQSGPLDVEVFLASLARMPLPAQSRVEQAFLAGVAHGPLPSDDLDAEVAAAVGLEPTDPVASYWLAHAEDRLVLSERLGYVTAADGERVCSPRQVCRGLVLTTRVAAPDALDLTIDLAGLRYAARPLRTEDGQPVDEQDGIAFGPPDWLAAFAEDDLVAVTADGGRLRVIRVEAGPNDSEVDAAAATLRGVYDREIAEAQLPIELAGLVVSARVADPGIFATPLLPLGELVARAGLERRGELVGHDESVWQADAMLRRQVRVRGEFVDAEQDVLLDLLDAADAVYSEGVVEPSELRASLDELVAADLIEAAADVQLVVEVVDAVALSAKLGAFWLRVASRPRQRAAAGYLAAIAAETDGQLRQAEMFLRDAVTADPLFILTADRLAWTLSDRGRAEEAQTVWHRIGASDPAELGVLVGPTPLPIAATLSRNDPCWCGSGRKFKLCHLRSTALAPLEERLDWLIQKRLSYLMRRGGVLVPDLEAAVDSFTAATEQADAHDHDHDHVHEHDHAHDLPDYFSHPLLLDVVLHEWGWEQRFLAERGPLLPPDELQLAEAWAAVPRQLVEVVEARSGGAIVRPAGGSEAADPTEVSVSYRLPEPRQGVLLCARLLPIEGGTHLGVGTFSVPADRADELAGLLALPAWERGGGLLAFLGREVLGG